MWEDLQALLERPEDREINPDEIDHVVKVDPEKFDGSRNPSDTEGTDMVMFGGTYNVNGSNALETARHYSDVDVPLVQEPGSEEDVSLGTIMISDALFVPIVSNGDYEHERGAHRSFARKVHSICQNLAEQIEELREIAKYVDSAGKVLDYIPDGETTYDQAFRLVGDKTYKQHYIVQNTDASVAEKTGVEQRMTAQEVAEEAAFARLFERPFNVYLEYSGLFDSERSPEDTKTVSYILNGSGIETFYGGNVDSYTKSEKISERGGTVVVGDIYHEDQEGFQETIRGAKK